MTRKQQTRFAPTDAVSKEIASALKAQEPSTKFETKTCGRCGGSGHYSYCQSWGTVCFGCRGTRLQYTKRGAAARRYYDDSLKVRLDSLVIGDLMRVDGVTMSGGTYSYFANLVEIKPSSSKYLDKIDGEWKSLGNEYKTYHPKHGYSGLVAAGDYMVRKGWDGATKDARKAEALAYQDTLTQVGTVRKRSVVA